MKEKKEKRIRSKYIPSSIAGEKIGLDGRIECAILGGILLPFLPFYVVGEVNARVREYFSRGEYYSDATRLDEIFDLLKWIYSSVRYGRLPDVMEQNGNRK